MEQGEDEATNESRVRAKSQLCGFNPCSCNQVYKTCNFNHKEDEIKMVLEELKPDILCLTETWLDEYNPKQTLELPDYKLYERIEVKVSSSFTERVMVGA